MFKHLTQNERYYIWQRIANLDSLTKIAQDLNVHKSTVSRELKRNSKEDGSYNPGYANMLARERKSKASSKKRFSFIKPKLTQLIISYLHNSWSPEQISGRLRKKRRSKISHQTIYNYINHDKLVGGTLYRYLPHQGKKYSYKAVTAPVIPNRIDISKRPKIVEKKSRIGDFEIDTVIGTKAGSHSCLLTLVDRKSKFTFIRKLPTKMALSVQHAIENIYDKTMIPFNTITADNGSEFANHQQISKSIGCQFYFARPYHSCDRALNEHTNGLIRRFLPKKTDFNNVTDDTIVQIQDSLNSRPRKVLGYLTPAEVMLKHLKVFYPKASLQFLI